jgi:glycosyltransferase involved in cell wall biosynthesis/SAM-dependent methyltransferase
MPVYNGAETIGEAVESIMTDNIVFGDELIIVNDGSTDKTPQVLKALRKKFPKIRAIDNKKNLGCPASRNIGIRAARNELIFNLDADDVLEAGSVQKLKNFLLINSADVAAFGEIHFFRTSTSQITHRWILPSGRISLADYLSGPYVPGGNYLYTKKSWQKIGGYWEYGRGLHEFWGFSLKQIASGSRFYVAPSSHYYHRYGQSSLFTSEIGRDSKKLPVATRMIKPFFNKLDPSDVDYIKSTPDWMAKLSARPIKTITGEKGRSGIVVFNDYKQSGALGKIIDYLPPEINNFIFFLKNNGLNKIISFIKQYRLFRKSSDQRFRTPLSSIKLCLSDKEESLNFDTHYVYYPAWAARALVKIKPKRHVDVSSLLVFNAIISADIKTEFYEFRPANINLPNLSSGFADLLALPFQDNSIPSLSCMHAVEHLGLGRYGDPIDPYADVKAIGELTRVLAPGGNLLFVTPVGQPVVRFNAHRIYSLSQVLGYFSGLELVEFTLIPDGPRNLALVSEANNEMVSAQKYGCGCFWFRKPRGLVRRNKSPILPKVSVIIPVFNGQQFIGKAIDSVLHQTYLPAEIIVVDDGSTDGTADIVKGFFHPVVKILYVSKKHGGASSARNLGILRSKSELLAFLDADDVWERDKLQRQVEVFQKTSDQTLGVVYCDYGNISPEGLELENFRGFVVDPHVKGRVYEKLLSGNKIAGSDSAVLVRRECFQRQGLFDEQLVTCEDWDMWLRIAKEFTFDYVPQKLVWLRRHPASLQRNQQSMIEGEARFINKRIREGFCDLGVVKRFRYRLFGEFINGFPRSVFQKQLVGLLSLESRKFVFGDWVANLRLIMILSYYRIVNAIFK